MNRTRIRQARQQLLAWYDRHGRDLPWRYKNAQKPDPYYVWLSEIMCQQTTVQAVIPYFMKFTRRWPTIRDLAAAPQEEVMNEWAGLGYYARARNLHKCARVVTNELNGAFPQTQKELKTLPGIGDYTSAAIAAIAWNEPATVMDGNIERVIARLYNIQEPLPGAKPALKNATAPFFENFNERPGDLAQAFMDLGASVCTPKSPKCMICPVADHCRSRAEGTAKSLPVREPKKPKPKKFGYVYWIENGQGNILLERRNEKSMLGGMTAFPTSNWTENKTTIPHPDFLHSGLPETGQNFITHSFTHFDLKLFLLRLTDNHLSAQPAAFYWQTREELEQTGFPTLFRKAYKLWTAED